MADKEAESDSAVKPPEESIKGEGTEQQPATPDATPDGLKRTPVVWISGILSLLFILGAVNLVTSGSEPNQCKMTYMFEYPQYIKINLPSKVQNEFPRYNLYVYSEGKLADHLQEKHFEGIPVLFIPGNAGSYKQVRSLASVALRKAIENSKYKTHFDFFAVDFGEELSGIYGGVLQDQSRFTAICIKEILNLYEEQVKVAISDEALNSTEIPPESVLVIGHSIGGMVARAFYLQPGFEAHLVNTIITLATPHYPVAVTDSDVNSFYNDVNKFWKAERDNVLKHVSLVTIGGGFRDVQVRPDLTKFELSNLSVSTTATSSVWVSTDHLCIVWCKQLVMALNRVLFDLINHRTKQLTFDKELRQKVFEYHLIKQSAEKTYKSILNGGRLHSKQITFDKEGQWIDLLKRQYVYKSQSKKWEQNVETTHLMIRTFDDPKHDELTLDAINMDLDDWVFACKATTVYKGTRLCETGDNLSNMSHIIPSNGKRKTLRISLKDMRLKFGYTHVVVVIPKRLVDARVIVDVYNPADRSIPVELPRWMTFFKSQVVLERTVPNALFYNISLKGLEQMWQAYTVQILPREGKCRSKTHFGLIQHVPSWAHESEQTLIGFNLTNKLTVKLQSPPPLREGETVPVDYRSDVIMYLNPNCVYAVAVRPEITEMWSQMVRYYYPMTLAFITSVVLVTFANQLKLVEEPEKISPEPKFHSFFVILGSKVSPMSAVLPCRLLAGLLSTAALASKLPFPTDLAVLAASGTDFSLLPILLFFVSLGLTFIIAGAAWGTILLFGNVANEFVTRILSRNLPSVNEVVIDAAVGTLEKFPFLLSLLLVMVSASTCGTLALCLGTFSYFIHLFNLYKDYLKKKLLMKIAYDDFEEIGKIHFQFSVALLWFLVTLLNFPSLMTWTLNLESSLGLSKDPSQTTALVMCLTLPYLWGDSNPNLKLSGYSQLSGIISFFAIITVLYGCVSIFRVSYFVCGVLVCTALHQMIAETKPEPIIEKENEADKKEQ